MTADAPLVVRDIDGDGKRELIAYTGFNFSLTDSKAIMGIARQSATGAWQFQSFMSVFPKAEGMVVTFDPRTPIAVGDIDGAPGDEIAFLSIGYFTPLPAPFGTMSAYVGVMKGDGSSVPGFPVLLGKSGSSLTSNNVAVGELGTAPALVALSSVYSSSGFFKLMRADAFSAGGRRTRRVAVHETGIGGKRSNHLL